MMKPLGLYFHIPFCNSKCYYCDFYSVRPQEHWMEDYAEALCRDLKQWSEICKARSVDTVYFGGGTPPLLGVDRLRYVLNTVRSFFFLEPSAEITVEANPEQLTFDDLLQLRQGGFNRLSLGLQSANACELRQLGRRHTSEDALRAITDAKRAGFDNISLDLMLALEGQTKQSVAESVDFCRQAGVQHISAYLLKIEEGTLLSRRVKEKKYVPQEEEQQRELYLFTCERLEQAGFHQYEISNFALAGKESRHNTKYWKDEEYLGLGAAAHSFLNGKRFYFPRDFRQYIQGTAPIADGAGGDAEEYLMLGLRLCKGISKEEYRGVFGETIPERYLRNAEKYEKYGLTVCTEEGFRLTREGFLVSNQLIGEILYG